MGKSKVCRLCITIVLWLFQWVQDASKGLHTWHNSSRLNNKWGHFLSLGNSVRAKLFHIPQQKAYVRIHLAVTYVCLNPSTINKDTPRSLWSRIDHGIKPWKRLFRINRKEQSDGSSLSVEEEGNYANRGQNTIARTRTFPYVLWLSSLPEKKG